MAEKRIYVDTNVYMDYFEDRKDNLKPLGELALQLFERTFSCEFKIIMSSLVLNELKKWNHLEDGTDFIAKLKGMNKVEFVNENSEDRESASRRKEGSHYADRLHYVLAEKAKAELFITRNWTDFYGLGDIPVLQPEFA